MNTETPEQQKPQPKTYAETVAARDKAWAAVQSAYGDYAAIYSEYLVSHQAAGLKEPPDQQRFITPDPEPNSAGGHHMDGETGVFWIGIRLTVLDLKGAEEFLASMRFQLWLVYRELVRQLKQRQQLVAPAGGARHPGEDSRGMMARLMGKK